MKVIEIPAKPKEQKKIRVAAYARVSSDKDAAFHSLTSQTEYYEKYIAAHPDWELVGIYSDNSISGATINRPEFQRMLEDCRSGRIDLIVTKSVTRFARNTVVLLETIQELKRLGIDCYFEKEDMHSIGPDGELLLTLLALYAEEEARSASENQKWRIRKKFERGEPWTGKMLGYRLQNGKMVVVPEEAEIVKRIYADYLSGMGKGAIAKSLILAGVAPKSGNQWAESSIYKILTNEKYTGDLILQKTFRPDFRTKVNKVNRGEVRQYYVAGSHEAIIDQDTFLKVQTEIAARALKYPRVSNAVYHLFSGMIRCGNCGRRFKHYRTNAKQYDKSVWACTRYYALGKTICPSQRIPEDILIEKTKEILSVETVDRATITDKIEEIVVPARGSLQFVLKDGTLVDTKWQHRSRKESWTPEMRKAARDKELARRKKENS